MTEQELLRSYLDDIIARYRYLDFKGISQLDRIVSLELDDLFVPVRASSWWPSEERSGSAATTEHRSDGVLDVVRALSGSTKDTSGLLKKIAAHFEDLAPSDAALLADMLKSGDLDLGFAGERLMQQEKQRLAGEDVDTERSLLLKRLADLGKRGCAVESEDVKAILKKDRKLVLVGDPGSGKTTVVKWLARTYALGASKVKERLDLDENLVPIVVPAAAFSLASEPGQPLPSISDFVKSHFNKRTEGLGNVLARKMVDGDALILLDGLDEISVTDKRVEVAIRVHAFVSNTECRCLVTSRIYGYSVSKIRDVSHWRVSQFGEDQIRSFIRSWSWGFETTVHPRGASREAADAAAGELEEAIFEPGSARSDSLRSFAENPLLLTILALVKRQYRILPEQRVRLYDLSLRTLFETWNSARGLSGPVRGVQMDVAEALGIWEPVALWMHSKYPGGTAPRHLIIQQLSKALAEAGYDGETATATAESYLDTAAGYTGVLIERGAEVFGFLHQTFQEYLAARAVLRRHPKAFDALTPYLMAPRWREVVLLAAGYLGAVQERVLDSTELVQSIVYATDVLEPYLHRYRQLALAIIADRTPVGRKTVDELLSAVLDECVEPDAVDEDDEDELATSVAVLSKYAGSPGVLAKAADIVRNPLSDWVLASAIVLLGAEGGSHVRQLLNNALEHDDEDVRGLAAAVLIMNGESDLESIAPHLKLEWYATESSEIDRRASTIIFAAWNMHQNEVEVALLNVTGSGDTDSRRRAACILLERGVHTEEAELALLDVIRSDSAQNRARATRTLLQRGVHTENAELALLNVMRSDDLDNRRWAAGILLERGVHVKEVERALLDAVRSDGLDNRRWAAGILLERGVHIKEVEQALLDAIGSGDTVSRRWAAKALLEADVHNNEAELALLDMMRNGSALDRCRAASILLNSDAHTEEAESALLDAMRSSDTDSRRLAASILLERGAHIQEAELAMVDALRGSDIHRQHGAVSSLMSRDVLTQEAESALLNVIRSDGGQSRVWATRILLERDVHTETAELALLDMTRSGDLDSRRWAASILLQHGAHIQEAELALLDVMRSGDTDGRHWAARTLLERGVHTEGAATILSSMLLSRSRIVRIYAAAISLDSQKQEQHAPEVIVKELTSGSLSKDPLVAGAGALARYLDRNCEPEDYPAYTCAQAGPTPKARERRRGRTPQQPRGARRQDERNTEPQSHLESDSIEQTDMSPQERIGRAVDEALKALSGNDRHAPARLRAQLEEPNKDNVAALIGALKDRPEANIFETPSAQSMEKGSSVEGVLAWHLARRLKELTSTARESVDLRDECRREEMWLVPEIPRALLPAVADEAVDAMHPSAQAVVIDELLKQEFSGESSNARQVIGLYCSLLNAVVDAKARQKVVHRAKQLFDSGEEEAQISAVRCMAILLPDLDRSEAARTLDGMSLYAGDHYSHRVREATVSSLRLISHRFKDELRAQFEKMDLPSVYDIRSNRAK